MKDYSTYISLAYAISLLSLGAFLVATWVQIKRSGLTGDSGEA